MLFNSFSFLAFFAVLVVVYYAIPHRFRWMLLLATSLYYYSTFNVNYVLLLLASALAAYLLALAIGASPLPGRKRVLLALGVLVSLAPLFLFKYVDFFAGSLDGILRSSFPDGSVSFTSRLNLLLPAGLSFYTFSCISYLVDVYRAKLQPARHLGHFTLYVSFFPKLLAGPIERATTFLPQLLAPIRLNPDNITLGLQQVLWGLFKKVVIADRLAIVVNSAYLNPSFASPVTLIIGSYFFAFQIYCDFSGYSDIAIGTARILGIDLMENFRRPYMATSAPEFWSKNRWHISLSHWFRDYMYIPMGGSKVAKSRMYFNQMAVFVVSGLWHGANWTFVIWGALNGFYQVATLLTAGIRDKIAKLIRLPAALGSILGAFVTFHLVLLAWVFFRASTVTDAVDILQVMVGAIPRLPALLGSYPFTGELILSFVLILVLLVIEILDERCPLSERLRDKPRVLRWGYYYALLVCLVVIGKWGLSQFVYMQF
jgi:alginate O-acetyltransferase complex protein AlgI